MTSSCGLASVPPQTSTAKAVISAAYSSDFLIDLSYSSCAPHAGRASRPLPLSLAPPGGRVFRPLLLFSCGVGEGGGGEEKAPLPFRREKCFFSPGGGG